MQLYFTPSQWQVIRPYVTRALLSYALDPRLGMFNIWME